MGKKIDALKIEFNKLSLKVDLLNEYVSEKLGFDEDTEKVKCKCGHKHAGIWNLMSQADDDAFVRAYEDHSEPKFQPLPEGVKFYMTSRSIYFAFGHDQAICYDKEFDYLVAGLNIYKATEITNKCHLEPCKIEDLHAGDWYLRPTSDSMFLFIEIGKSFCVEQRGDIYCLKNAKDMEVKRVIYTP